MSEQFSAGRATLYSLPMALSGRTRFANRAGSMPEMCVAVAQTALALLSCIYLQGIYLNSTSAVPSRRLAAANSHSSPLSCLAPPAAHAPVLGGHCPPSDPNRSSVGSQRPACRRESVSWAPRARACGHNCRCPRLPYPLRHLAPPLSAEGSLLARSRRGHLRDILATVTLFIPLRPPAAQVCAARLKGGAWRGPAGSDGGVGLVSCRAHSHLPFPSSMRSKELFSSPHSAGLRRFEC